MKPVGISYNDYEHELYDLHEPKKLGNFGIRKLTIHKKYRDRFWYKGMGVCECLHLDDYHIVQLVKNGKKLVNNADVLMSDTPVEVETNKKAIRNAFGDVLELGMGIGYFTYHASQKKNVKSITIVELRKGIIDLVYPVIKNEKTNVINADAMKFLKTSKKKFDMINIDFVGGMEPFKNFDKIMALAKRLLKPKGKAIYWQEDIWNVARKHVPKKPVYDSGFSFDQLPCWTCGKSRRSDFNGFCADCADIMGFSKFDLKSLPLKPNGKIDTKKMLKQMVTDLKIK